MKSKICYVDPVYFITHKLYNKSFDSNSAYFDIFEEDIQDNYEPSYDTSIFPTYVGTGIYADHLYYDVGKNEKEYVMIIYVIFTGGNISINLGFNLDIEKLEDINFIAALSIYDNALDESIKNESIYFDTFNDLYGIIKNNIRQHLNIDKDNHE